MHVRRNARGALPLRYGPDPEGASAMSDTVTNEDLAELDAKACQNG